MAKNAFTTESPEDRLIRRHFAPLATDPGAFGLEDDTAILTVPAGQDLVLTTDPIIAGVHFFPDDPPEMVAHKALRVNLSDLAAKGARPVGFLMALALPAAITEPWLAAFATALGEDARRFGCPLLGGDTDRTPGPLTVSISAYGTLPAGTIVHRRGARPGDRIVVSGTIGDAALGLFLRRAGGAEPWAASLATDQRDHLLRRYAVPQPRTILADSVRRHASAAMDVSDGLAGDVAKLCRASGVSAGVDAACVPLSDAARAALAADPSVLEAILSGGDDYEILCTMDAAQLDAFRSAAVAAGVPVTDIGSIVAGSAPPRFRDPQGRELAFDKPSFSHF